MTNQEIARKREKEKQLVSFMIDLYCHKKHHTNSDELCDECLSLKEYALSRVEHCPHMETKTFCSKCKTKCYKPDMKAKIKEVMKFSGPRMLIFHPIIAIRHLIENKKYNNQTGF